MMKREEMEELAECESVMVVITTGEAQIGVWCGEVNYSDGEVAEVSGELAAELIVAGRARLARPGAEVQRRVPGER